MAEVLDFAATKLAMGAVVADIDGCNKNVANAITQILASQTFLGQMPAKYAAALASVDSLAAKDAGLAAMKAEKDAAVANFLAAKAKVDAIVAAINSVK